MFRVLTCFFLLAPFRLCAQETYDVYPKVLYCPDDSFAVKWNSEAPHKYPVADFNHNFNFGAVPGASGTLYFGKDSVHIKYKNKVPAGQYTFFIMKGLQYEQLIRIGFDPQPSIFEKKYIESNTGNIQFDIPEVYELSNVIWALSPSGRQANDLNKNSSYYKRVLQYFQPFLKHPIFSKLIFPDSTFYSQYLNFRENSFAFNFKPAGAKLQNYELLLSGPYYYVFGDQYADSSLFGKLKPLVEDFAKKSDFRKFYTSNKEYYQQEIKRLKELLPVRQMWAWLEKEFPKTKYQSYRVVFSPLIGGSHSTQNYSTYQGGSIFRENVMFISDAERVDSIKTLSEKQKEGLMSRVIFTEIDHNYVNRETNKYSARIDSIFSIRGKWAADNPGASFYGSSVPVFNEYMTWAVFCLYANEVYDNTAFPFINNETISRMVEKRGFVRFKEFNQALQDIRVKHKDLKVVDLYPYILDWCAHQ